MYRFCFQMCKMLCCPFIITLVELNVSKVCCKSHWLDGDFGRSPNNGCTLHQWEHPFLQSVPHMALRPLLHALSRQRVSFMPPDTVSLRASWPSDQLFWSDLALWQRKTFYHTYIKEYFETDSLWTVRGVELPAQVTICARTDRRSRFVLGRCLQLVGEYICYHRLSLKQKCEWIFLLKHPLKHHTAAFSHFFKSSVKAQFSCCALEERLGVDLLLFAKVL